MPLALLVRLQLARLPARRLPVLLLAQRVGLQVAQRVVLEVVLVVVPVVARRALAVALVWR